MKDFSSIRFVPQSEKVVFYDSEFTTLDPYRGELLSIGMVDMTGKELYVELEYNGETSAWVNENILPTLDSSRRISRKEAVEKITEFLGERKPYLLSFVAHYDMVYLHKLFGVRDDQQSHLPYFWMPVDFASMLFSVGVDPAYYTNENPEFFGSLGIDVSQYRKHNALDDARLLREVYRKMCERRIA